MMTEDELRDICVRLRSETLTVDVEMVDRIVSDVAEYRQFFVPLTAQLPPEHLAPQLPLMGWLIYEASLQALRRVAPAFDLLSTEARDASVAAYKLVAQLADAARTLPWPEFAPRALGAVRAQALAESKRDTEKGYDNAWILHTEAREKERSYRDALSRNEANSWQLLALDETLVQLALAETGTACRTAERIICRWSEGLDTGEWKPADEVRWIQRMFRELSDGMSSGELALEIVARLDNGPGLVRAVDERRMALVTAYRNPAIMTARAALLLLALSPEMEVVGRSPSAGGTWQEFRKNLVTRFEVAYRLIERPIYGDNGSPMPPSKEHIRSLVQLRLNAALLAPGLSLASSETYLPCLSVDPLNDDAVEALSSWLADTENGRRNGDANVIGSATMPGFIRSVEAFRATFSGVIGGYREWRRRWPTLDRYAVEPDRLARVEGVL